MKHQQQLKNLRPSKLKPNQVAIKDKRFLTRVDLNVPQSKQDPDIIMNTARTDDDLPKPSSIP